MRNKMDLFERMIGLMLLVVVAGAVFPMLVSETSMEASAQEGGAPPTLTDGRMYLKEGMSMDPVPPDVNDEFQMVSIPNGFIQDGIFGYGFLPIGHTYWRDVGIWTTQPLRQQINLGGQVEIVIFAAKEGNSVTADFEFQILRQNEADPMIQLVATNQRILGGSEATRISVRGAFPPGNDTTVEADTQLVFKVRARCQIQDGGASLRFGSNELASGFSFGSNALQAHALYMTEDEITFEYKDSFMIPWVKMYTLFTLNGIEQTQAQISSQMNSMNQTRMIIYKMENVPGRYELFASIAYDPSGYGNVSMQSISTLTKPKFDLGKEVTSFLKARAGLLIFLFLLFATPFVLARWRSKVWRRRFLTMPHDTRDLSKRKKKRIWKDDKKKLKLDRKDRRNAQKLKHEEALAKGEEHWSLFNKKQKDQEPKIIAADLKDLDLDL